LLSQAVTSACLELDIAIQISGDAHQATEQGADRQSHKYRYLVNE